jgi:mono/diheme cytochrome c family protein
MAKTKLSGSLIVALLALTACGTWADAAVSESPRAEFFEKKIRPILMDNCYKCHSPAGGRLKGGLNLSSREGLLKGGEKGSAVVPGHPENSRLIEAIHWTNKDLQMPPKTPLSESAIADLEKWVQMGAPWAGGELKGAVGPSLANYEKLRQTHWAWQPLRTPRTPAVKNTAWPLCDVDKFVLAKMEQNGLHPVGQADKYELLRRATFDLTGLPPSVPEIDAFVADSSPDAYAKVVDRLLASPAFGERWGRHWLDVARYAESTGSSRNYPYEYAWRYRDYVIDAFNADKPFNQFILEQIAGDQLPFRSAKQHDDQLIATGFLAMGVKDLNEKDRLKYTMDNVDEQIDVVGKSMLGLTVSCARCHDHKFDPIPQADYYRLAGIFKSTDILCGLTARKGAGGRNAENDALLVRLDPLRGPNASSSDSANAQKQLKELEDRLDTARAELRNEAGRTGKRADAFAADRQQAKKQRQQIGSVRQEIQNLETQIQVLQQGSALAIGVKDAPRPVNSPLYEHGETDAPGPIVPRGTIGLCKFISMQPIPANQSGRLELARWIASRDNPLTPRVAANRIWHDLFGEGIVRTVDNFGTTGEAPSNPELLDYLANRFVQNGWSFKKTIRELVLSRTYQLAGTWDSGNGVTDPGDRYLWRSAPRRLEAEEIRDAILLASGTLDSMRPAGSPVMASGGGELRRFNAQAAARAEFARYRSVYLPILRDLLPASLERFDFANPEMVTGDREVTTVAPQALYLMNDPFVINHSQQMARRVLESSGLDEPARIDLAYRIAFGRPATGAEQRRASDYLYSFTSDGDSARTAPPRNAAWTSLCQALVASAEFRYVN